MDHRIKLNILKILNSTNKDIVLEWVPGHANIKGNELADLAAKSALDNRQIVKLPLIHGDYKTMIKTFIFSQWQDHWNRYGRCRLKKFKPILGDWKSAYRDNRKDEKIISRLRTGSCLFLYHHYFDTNQQIETCTTCNIVLTTKHIIVECPALNNNRRRITNYLNQKNRDLTEENILCDYFPQDLLLKFLKETQYYKKI